MEVIYARQPLPDRVEASIFLAGPTPRSRATRSWRPEALDMLRDLGFSGHVFVPEDRCDFVVWTACRFACFAWATEIHCDG